MPVRGKDPTLQVITRFINGKPLRSAHRYDPTLDAFVPAPFPADDEE